MCNLRGTHPPRHGKPQPSTSKPEGDGASAVFAHAIVIYLVALVLSLPLFLLIAPHLPRVILPVGHGFRVDHLIAFVLVLGAFIVLVKRFQLAIYTALVIGLAALTFTSLTDRYGFGDLYRDYRVFLASLRANTEPLPLSLAQLGPFQDAELLLARIDHQDPELRAFAVQAATTWFKDAVVREDEYTLVQAFSIFKVINGSWTYVSDVKGGEYFAPASESARLLAGDCDDHAILMAACLKAIGAEVRLVRTSAHIYPELRVGDDKAMARAAQLIREVLFPDVARYATLFYHTDANGDRWINLDYTRNYPGGEVMHDDIRGILVV